jgi:hypothetical protein
VLGAADIEERTLGTEDGDAVQDRGVVARQVAQLVEDRQPAAATGRAPFPSDVGREQLVTRDAPQGHGRRPGGVARGCGVHDAGEHPLAIGTRGSGCPEHATSDTFDPAGPYETADLRRRQPGGDGSLLEHQPVVALGREEQCVKEGLIGHGRAFSCCPVTF